MKFEFASGRVCIDETRPRGESPRPLLELLGNAEGERGETLGADIQLPRDTALQI